MTRDHYNILDITPSLKINWTVLVQVLEVGHVLETNNKSEYRRLLFTDSQGTRVTTLIFEFHLTHFKNTFEPYRRYSVSNANLIKAQTRFLVSSYPHSWSLNKITLVEPHPEIDPPVLPCHFAFTPFNQLYRFADEENYQSIRAVVVRCLPSEQGEDPSNRFSRRDIVIVNEEKKLMILTLWGSLDQKEGRELEQKIDDVPMIFAMRVKVTTFYGLSLSTKGASAILINPPVTAELQLKAWYNENRSEIQELLNKESYKDVDLLLPYPQEPDILPIATAIERLKNGKPTWMRGNLRLQHEDNTFTHTVCANCLKSIGVDVTWIITCNFYKKESEVEIRSRAIVEINDGTASIRTSIASPDLEKFIPFSPQEVKDAEEEGTNIYNIISSSIDKSSVVAFVRSYTTSHQRKSTTRYVIVKAHKTKDNNLIEGSGAQETNLKPRPTEQEAMKAECYEQSRKDTQLQVQPLKEIVGSTDGAVTQIKETDQHKPEEKEIVTVTPDIILKPHEIKQEALKRASNQQTQKRSQSEFHPLKEVHGSTVGAPRPTKRTK
ncbi:unnamed protein product [Lactuca saligna]|uniref:Replication protein A OB domain-containing protein n=1 Tax=Lactuca saligna TaxID=75948 RepID=A0AA35Y904_LACSI|nr:unnamed protein product [Lactuca saligna]